MASRGEVSAGGAVVGGVATEGAAVDDLDVTVEGAVTADLSVTEGEFGTRHPSP